MSSSSSAAAPAGVGYDPNAASESSSSSSADMTPLGVESMGQFFAYLGAAFAMKFVLGGNDLLVLLPFMTGTRPEKLKAGVQYVIAMTAMVAVACGVAVSIKALGHHFALSKESEEAADKWTSIGAGIVLLLYACYILYDEVYGDDDGGEAGEADDGFSKESPTGDPGFFKNISEDAPQEDTSTPAFEPDDEATAKMTANPELYYGAVDDAPPDGELGFAESIKAVKISTSPAAMRRRSSLEYSPVTPQTPTTFEGRLALGWDGWKEKMHKPPIRRRSSLFRRQDSMPGTPFSPTTPSGTTYSPARRGSLVAARAAPPVHEEAARQRKLPNLIMISLLAGADDFLVYMAMVTSKFPFYTVLIGVPAGSVIIAGLAALLNEVEAISEAIQKVPASLLVALLGLFCIASPFIGI